MKCNGSTMRKYKALISQKSQLQLRAKQIAPLLRKHYQNDVPLTGENPPLKCCQPLEILAQLKTALDIFLIKIWGL